MIALTFCCFVFVFSVFFLLFLWLSYVFADGELKFNYFVVKVKSCFQDEIIPFSNVNKGRHAVCINYG